MTSQWETDLSFHYVLPQSEAIVITRGYFSKTVELSNPLLHWSRRLGVEAHYSACYCTDPTD